MLSATEFKPGCKNQTKRRRSWLQCRCPQSIKKSSRHQTKPQRRRRAPWAGWSKRQFAHTNNTNLALNKTLTKWQQFCLSQSPQICTKRGSTAVTQNEQKTWTIYTTNHITNKAKNTTDYCCRVNPTKHTSTDINTHATEHAQEHKHSTFELGPWKLLPTHDSRYDENVL